MWRKAVPTLTETTSRWVSTVTTTADFRGRLDWFRRRFRECVVDGGDLERIVDAYARLIIDDRNSAVWAQLVEEPDAEFIELVDELRLLSARCVALAEKHQARRWLNHSEQPTTYLDNIEDCIEQEFGAFALSSDSQVLLVGCGAFPMAPLLIAARSGARVVGIDIDAEAVALGRAVVASKNSSSAIELRREAATDLDFTNTATHVVFSSTVAEKYAILDAIHPLTRDDVVVAMRYGDGVKSLFNYPSQTIDHAKWTLADTIARSDHIFDVAIYVKS